MSKVFTCAATPDGQAIRGEGAVAVVTAIEAGDERRARAKFHWQLLEHYPAVQNCAYKFAVCEDKPDVPRPAFDSWDAECTQENHWDGESTSFILVETESGPVDVIFDKLAPEVQNVVTIKFNICENITVDMIISVQELLQEDVTASDGHIIEALMGMLGVNAMYPELKPHITEWVKHKYKPSAKWPKIQTEIRIWKKYRRDEREKTGKHTLIVDLAHARVNQQHSENSTGRISPVIAAIHRECKRVWKTLDDELAYALWLGDVDTGNIDGNIHRQAKNEVVDNGHEGWKRISASMRRQPDTLHHDRQTIFGLVHERPIDIHKDPVALNKYTAEYLTAKGVFGDEGRNQSATDTLLLPVPEAGAAETTMPNSEKTGCGVEGEPSVEREGLLCFLFIDKDGEKYGRANKLSGLGGALALGATETIKEEYFTRKNGMYFGPQQNTGASDMITQPEPVKVTADEVSKVMQAANINRPNTNKLFAASCGEFVAGTGNPNDPKWVRGTETRDLVGQNQQETEQNGQKAEQSSPDALQNEPETKQPESVAQQRVGKVYTACGWTGGGNCLDCDAMVGDATYQETFNEEYQVEVQEDNPEEMEDAEYPHEKNIDGNQHHDNNNEVDGTADHSTKVNGHQEITPTSRTCDHLMIDLEAMGKNPNAPIISIGVIFFGPQTGDMGPEFSRAIDLETVGGVIDRDVIKWRFKQSREVQSAIMTDEILLDDALSQSREFINEDSGEFFVQIWGNGANFDNTTLRRSYEWQGIPYPWRYYNDYDVRTIVELKRVIDFDTGTAIPFGGERRNAPDNACYQAKYVSAIWQKPTPDQTNF